jgi:hypothetical protein
MVRVHDPAGQWIAWTWNERVRLWVQVCEGSRENIEGLLTILRSERAEQFAMSESGQPLPEPPALKEEGSK